MLGVVFAAHFVATAPLIADDDEYFAMPMRRMSNAQRFGLVPFPRVGRAAPGFSDEESVGPKRAVSFPAIRFGKRAPSGAMFPAIRFGKRQADDFDASI